MSRTSRTLTLALALAGLMLIPSYAQEVGQRKPPATATDDSKDQDAPKQQEKKKDAPKETAKPAPRSGSWGAVTGQTQQQTPQPQPAEQPRQKQAPRQQPQTPAQPQPQPRWQQSPQQPRAPEQQPQRPESRWQTQQPPVREQDRVSPREGRADDWLRQILPQVNAEPPRLSEQRQRQLIDQQKQRSTAYDQQLQRQRRTIERRGSMLQRQHRTSQYRYHQRYLDHLRDQQLRLRMTYDYTHDPFFFTGPTYRYMRDGRWYSVNEYAAMILQDAVNYGYEQGYFAGQADREDRWYFDYENSFAYQDANYGYDGFYVSQSEYNFYFRQGFRRGYDDGYYGRHRYGMADDDGLRIMSDVLRLILDLQVLR